VLRDYYCSSTSKASYLWHPIDLLAQTGTLAPDADLKVLDAVALKLSRPQTEKIVLDFAPQFVYALTSAGRGATTSNFRTAQILVRFSLILSGEIFFPIPSPL